MNKIINKAKEIILEDFGYILWASVVAVIISLMPLFAEIVFGKDIKPCENFCCIHVKYIVAEDIIEGKLIRTKHGSDCEILFGYKANAVAYAINTYREKELIDYWFCNGEMRNYDVVCRNFCCKHIKYVLDLTMGILHKPDCEKLIENNDPYMSGFKSEKYNLIKMGYRGDYTKLCHCLKEYARIW